MKKIIFLLLLTPSLTIAQIDFFGPQPFDQILKGNFSTSWTPSALTEIENRKYVVIIDQSTMSNVINLSNSSIEAIEYSSINNITGSLASYALVMNSIFQIVDENSHLENHTAGGSGVYNPLSGLYKLNPLMHSYYNLNSDASFVVNSTNGGSVYMTEPINSGYLLIKFSGTSASTTIEAVEQWVYNANSKELEEATAWETRYLMIDNGTLRWTTNSVNASNFFLADAKDLINLEIMAGSDFNPLNASYEPNASVEIPSDINPMENSRIITDLPNKIANVLKGQLGNSASASSIASQVLDIIEITLIDKNENLRYPKEFYIALRENMLSHIISSSDIYNAKLGNNNVEHVYFTNESDTSGEPHPFMVIASHAVSTRPNLLADVNRPPGAEQGVGYGQSTVTRNGKLGEFLIKIPLKDYGLISTLLENDLSPYGNLASDYDNVRGKTTTKDVYNYASISSIGIAVDGVTIYPAQNNNLIFATEGAEVTSSGIHVGGGLELHYHADGHGFNNNGINLYNLSDFSSKNHPPVIGISYDGIALFGKYEESYPSMIGYNESLDEFGGHDHDDGFGYHYHAHKRTTTSKISPNIIFDQHNLLVGAWKGNINNIPGFLEVKANQLSNNQIGLYAGASSSIVLDTALDLMDVEMSQFAFFPNPVNNLLTIKAKASIESVIVYNMLGQAVLRSKPKTNYSTIDMSAIQIGIYFVQVSINNKLNTVKVIKN